MNVLLKFDSALFD